MNFFNLYNLVLENILLESMGGIIRELGKYHLEIENTREFYGKDKVELKKQLKLLKKKLIAKLVKEDYNSLLTNYFPELIPYKKESDEAFYNMMFKHPDIWNDMTQDMFKKFIDDIENGIEYFAERNNGEYDNLRYLLMRYIRF
jgi:hypothetical protein